MASIDRRDEKNKRGFEVIIISDSEDEINEIESVSEQQMDDTQWLTHFVLSEIDEFMSTMYQRKKRIEQLIKESLARWPQSVAVGSPEFDVQIEEAIEVLKKHVRTDRVIVEEPVKKGREASHTLQDHDTGTLSTLQIQKSKVLPVLYNENVTLIKLQDRNSVVLSVLKDPAGTDIP